MKVILSTRCYAAICYAVKKNPDLETGGILLGYREKRHLYVIENVFAGFNAVLEKTHFVLDDEYINYQSNIYANLYKKPLKILGFWHKHPTSNIDFSKKDHECNERFYKELNDSILSGVAYLDKNYVNLSLFMVNSEKTYDVHYFVKKIYKFYKYNI